MAAMAQRLVAREGQAGRGGAWGGLVSRHVGGYSLSTPGRAVLSAISRDVLDDAVAVTTQ